MAFRPEYDSSDLRKLEIDLRGAPMRIQRDAEKIVWRGADLVARGMRREVGGHRFLPHLPHTVSREMVGRYEAEIGMETSRKQGRLAHIMAYGSANNDPVFDHTAPLRAATPRIVKMTGDEGEDAVLGDDS